MLKEKITSDMKESMKAGDAVRLGVLRMLVSVMNNAKIEKRVKTGKDEDLVDDEIMTIIGREAKKRKESILVFESGGRTDLADGEKAELKILEGYLPAQMSESEIKSVLEKMVSVAPVKEFGVIMKEASKELRGKADGSFISKILKEILG